MNPIKRASRPAVVWVFVVVALFAWLGTRGLNEPDETRYAEIGREMAASGDWLIPYLNGFEHFQKPPFLYWMTALAFRLFGVNEWAARLPSALASLGTLYLTWRMAATLFGSSVQVTAVLLLLSTIEFTLLSRTLTPDMTLTFWITLAIACLVELIAGRGKSAWRVGFFVAMGFGFLAKGPMALLVPISAALCWQRGLRRRGQTIHLGWTSGLLITSSLAASWFVLVTLRHPALIQYFLEYELRDRLFSTVHGRSQPFWFFIPVLLIGMLPWTPLLLAVVYDAWKALRAKTEVKAESCLLGGWILPPLLVLSLSGSKLATYVLPLFPPLALLMARWCVTPSAESELRQAVRWGLICSLVLTIALPLVLFGMRIYDPRYRDVWFGGAFTILLVLLICLFSVLLSGIGQRQRTSNLILALGCGAILLWVGLFTQADRILVQEGGSVRPLVRMIEATPGADGAEVFALGVRGNGLEFYLQRLVSRTEAQSSIVLPVNKAQDRRLIHSQQSFLSTMGPRPAVGLVAPSFQDPGGTVPGWHVLGRSGRHLLIANDGFLAKGSPLDSQVVPTP